MTKKYYHAKDWTVLKVSGEERESFLQGQLTSDVAALAVNSFHLSARLNRQGKVQSFCYVLKKQEEIFLLILNKYSQSLAQDLKNYIISEDVDIQLTDKNLFFIVGSWPDPDKSDFAGLEGRFEFQFCPELTDLELSEEEIQEGFLSLGIDLCDDQLFIQRLLNETSLNILATSYEKGCFLGQETATKIQQNRGALYFPVILKAKNDLELGEIFINEQKIGVNHKQFVLEKNKYLALVKREYVQNQLQFPLFEIELLILTKKEKALKIYDQALLHFHNHNEKSAISLLDQAIAFYPMADFFEMKGVILSRLGDLEEAILCMDNVIGLNPQSVLAHTNKSLFYMKLGKITEAENEKSLATVKTFEQLGKDAELKREKQKNEERIKREELFLKVLELDPFDEMALTGISEINLEKQDFVKAKFYLSQAPESISQKRKDLLKKLESAIATQL